MKAFCMDVHISIIADFKALFPEIEIIDWCLSGHAWVMKRPTDYPNHINATNWKQFNHTMIQAFQTEYDTFLKTFDFFIVGYASCFGMIFEKYKKPIIVMNAVRYDVPFCWTQDLSMLSDYTAFLKRYKKLIVVSNNKADQLYLNRGTGLVSKYIPSVCDYTQQQYSPTQSTFLCYHGTVPAHPLITQKHELPHPHEWSDLVKFKGIISFPYEISLMSLFEQFTMGMPFFFPSVSFWKQNPSIQSVSAYWKSLPRYFGNDLKDVNTWIELADMYDAFQSPNTYYFDSFEHLFQLLESFVYVDDKAQRKERNETIRKTWKEYLLTHGLS